MAHAERRLQTKAESAIFKGMGVIAGIPDIFVLRAGRLFALELKAPGGRISPAQVVCHERLRAVGALVAVAVGLDDALARLEQWGLLRGRAVSCRGSPPKPQLDERRMSDV
jgi:hypothetical protein